MFSSIAYHHTTPRCSSLWKMETSRRFSLRSVIPHSSSSTHNSTPSTVNTCYHYDYFSYTKLLILIPTNTKLLILNLTKSLMKQLQPRLSTLQISKREQLSLQSWSLYLFYEALCSVLKSGTPLHLKVLWCGVVWCGVVCVVCVVCVVWCVCVCGVLWCVCGVLCVVWCGVCGEVWCGVVWCGVFEI